MQKWLTCITQKFDDGTIWSPTVSVHIRNKIKTNIDKIT